MFSKIIQTFVLFLFVLAIFSQSILAAEKTYYFSQVSIVINVKPDSSIHVEEKRTARFNGSFSRLYWDIPLGRDQGDKEIKEIKIAEIKNDNIFPYTPLPALDSSRPVDSYAFESNSTGVHIEAYFSATNIDKTLTLSYDLTNAVTKYQDVAELYWKVIGDGWGARTDKVNVTINLPIAVDQSQIYIWGHGPLSYSGFSTGLRNGNSMVKNI